MKSSAVIKGINQFRNKGFRVIINNSNQILKVHLYANSASPDQMLHSVMSNLALHCLSMSKNYQTDPSLILVKIITQSVSSIYISSNCSRRVIVIMMLYIQINPTDQNMPKATFFLLLAGCPDQLLSPL